MGKLSATLVLCLAVVAMTQAQDRVGPGSTVQGDILRGQGQFLKGAAWYEVGSAQANVLNTKAAIEWEKWNQQLYRDYMRERAAREENDRRAYDAHEAAARKAYEEREARLRTNPKPEEIANGDALNALLADLSDPSISLSSWRLAQVPLPPDLAIPSLVFRFAPRPGTSQTLGKGVIALARLDTAKGKPWGTVLSMQALAPERKAYELAYTKVRDQCLQGNLALDAPIALAGAIATLRAKVVKTVPNENGYRTAAMRDVDNLGEAAKIFHADTIDYAREMIADTQRHEAKTVGELLAFMRKYRLLFASSEKTLGGPEMYGRLYALMREQKDKLGLKGNVKSDLAAESHQLKAPKGDRQGEVISLLKSVNDDLGSIELVGGQEPAKKQQFAKQNRLKETRQMIEQVIKSIEDGNIDQQLLTNANSSLGQLTYQGMVPKNKSKMESAKHSLNRVMRLLSPATAPGGGSAEENVAADSFQPGAVWEGRLSLPELKNGGDGDDYKVVVRKRSGDTFQGSSTLGSRAAVPIQGFINGKSVRIVTTSGNGFIFEGEIKGNSVELRVLGRNNAKVIGSGTLTLKQP